MYVNIRRTGCSGCRATVRHGQGRGLCAGAGHAPLPPGLCAGTGHRAHGQRPPAAMLSLANIDCLYMFIISRLVTYVYNE
jgi:hypothetical protein